MSALLVLREPLGERVRGVNTVREQAGDGWTGLPCGGWP